LSAGPGDADSDVQEGRRRGGTVRNRAAESRKSSGSESRIYDSLSESRFAGAD